ncbi:MAG: hypothetical protein ACPGUF_00185 [Litorivicinus sp.]
MKPSRPDLPDYETAVNGLTDEEVKLAYDLYRDLLETAISGSNQDKIVRIGAILVHLGRRRMDVHAFSDDAKSA